MPEQDLLLTAAPDFSDWSADPSRPDYAGPEYRAMAMRWQLVHDIRGGTHELRAKRGIYLPKFEAETPEDWAARVLMTFAEDHYESTLEEHVGLIFAEPPILSDDVPDVLKPYMEDIDGEGNHFDVLLQSAMDSALHLGHAVLFTDYPVADQIKTKGDARRGQARPYVTLYHADDVFNARYETVGGVRVLVQIMFRERSTEADGEFGIKPCVRFREISQAVSYDVVSGRATSVGAITWRAWDRVSADDGGKKFNDAGFGTITGPDHICARVVYGGEKLGLMRSKPHLISLAFSNVEETQVQSDYATVMHKCNVPTPIFIGRNTTDADGKPAAIQMAQGIDIPQGGDAKMLEPTGAALSATRLRILDIRAQMRRKGATMDEATVTTKTAAEARLYAKQRNAKLARAARSLQDASEGMLADFAAFMQLPEGGSITVNQDFAGEGADPQMAAILWQAVAAGDLDMQSFVQYIRTGALPEDIEQRLDVMKMNKLLSPPPQPIPDPAADPASQPEAAAA